ncbi:MAG: hypothetical protein HY225_00220 [Candidatus Vogelbacteria bacterium]|nr:hypothetical protein [Candidatus Vogelbacteria bacterium]
MDTKENLTDTVKSVIKDSHHNHAHKAVLFKTERLVSAVHLVTSLMDVEDPLRWRLRTICIESLNDFYNIGQWQVNNEKRFISEKIFNNILHIISLLDIGLSGGLISVMNHKVLREEFMKLMSTLEKLKITNGADSFVLPDDFFGEDLSLLGAQSVASVIPETVKDIHHVSLTNLNLEGLSNTKIDRLKIGKGQIFPIKKTTTEKVVRQSLIVRILKDGGLFTIKDIIEKISGSDSKVDCSEKTIQRDLTFLVSDGTLIKQGERRWSKYSISR